MNTQFYTENDLSRVLQIICEIAEKSAHGDYIFRGESRSYGKVASSLYRQYEHDIEDEDFDIEFVQKEILDEASKYTEKTDELEILTELLYHGATTNLIEFTTDSHVALFFACDDSPTEDGRIILQKRDSLACYLRHPHEPKRRIIAQKTVFVQPPKGFINPDAVITIPADLKLSMLEYLRKSHGISTESVHNDLHGFIRNWSVHKSAYTQFHRGKTYQKKADSVQNWSEKLKWYERAIVHYNEALELKPDFPEGYNNRGTVYADAGDFDRAIRDYDMAIKLKSDYPSVYNDRGIAYYRKGDFDRAIQDFNRVIELDANEARIYSNIGTVYLRKANFKKAIDNYNTAIKLEPGFARFYSNRGEAWLHLKEWKKARTDLTFARNAGVDIIALFHNDYKSIEDFEEKNRVALPEDIAAILRQE